MMVMLKEILLFHKTPSKVLKKMLTLTDKTIFSNPSYTLCE